MRPNWLLENSQFVRFDVDQSAADNGVTRRIVAAIKSQIHAGALRAGDKVPSTRAFAAEWGVSRTTVTAAYGQLIAEGYFATHPGRRATVMAGLTEPPSRPNPPQDPPRRVSAFAERLLALPAPSASPPPAIADFRYGDLSAGDFPVLSWRRAVNAAMLKRGARLRYDDPQGSAALRSALQGYLWRARGIRCDVDDIVVVNGSQQGLDLCARLLLDPGDTFVMENPGYALARHAFLAAGATAMSTPVDAEGLATERLPPARIAYVTPSHQYPLGAMLSASRRRSLVAWAVASDAVIVEDDYDGEYRHDVAPIPPLRVLAPDRVVYVGTLSKTLSPTLRLGYLVVPKGLRRVFAEAKRLTDRHSPLQEQEALATLIASGAYERHVRSMRKRNADRRAVLLEALDGTFGPAVRIVGESTGLHVVAWFDGIPATREAAILLATRAAGVGLYPVSSLYEPADSRPRQVGFVMGYAALDPGAIRRGIAAVAPVLAEFA